MKDISAVIIAKNEADRIEKCITSLRSSVSEVLVIDNGSTDETIAIAKRSGAKVIMQDWLGYGLTKNIGAEYAAHEWILSIDCDEWLSEELEKELADLTPKSGQVYVINRANIYNGKVIKYSGWSPDWVYRLYEKSNAMWNDNHVHEKLIFTDRAKVKKLAGVVYHNSYRSIEDHILKTEKYAMLKAQSWIDEGRVPSWGKRYFGSFYKGFQSYILRSGFLDGKEGWQIARMNNYLVKKQVEFYDQLKAQ